MGVTENCDCEDADRRKALFGAQWRRKGIAVYKFAELGIIGIFYNSFSIEKINFVVELIFKN